MSVAGLRIGVFGSEVVKFLAGKPHEELDGDKLRELTSRALRIMRGMGFTCTEFGLSLKQLKEVAKVTSEEDGMDLIVNEVGSTVVPS